MGRKIFIPLFMFGMLVTDGYAVCSDHDANSSDCGDDTTNHCYYDNLSGLCLPDCEDFLYNQDSCKHLPGCYWNETLSPSRCSRCPAGSFCNGDGTNTVYSCPEPFDSPARLNAAGIIVTNNTGNDSINNCAANVSCSGAGANYDNIYLKCNNWRTVTIDDYTDYKCVPSSFTDTDQEFTQWSFQSDYYLDNYNEPLIKKSRVSWTRYNRNPDLEASHIIDFVDINKTDQDNLYHIEVKAKYENSPKYIMWSNNPASYATVWEELYAEEILCVPNERNCPEFAAYDQCSLITNQNTCSNTNGCYWIYDPEQDDNICVSNTNCQLLDQAACIEASDNCQWIGTLSDGNGHSAPINKCVSKDEDDIGANPIRTNCADGTVTGTAIWHNSADANTFGYWDISQCKCTKNEENGVPQSISENLCMGYQPKTYDADSSQHPSSDHLINIVRSIWEHIIFKKTDPQTSNYYCVQCLPDDGNTIYYANETNQSGCTLDLEHGHICKCEYKSNGFGYWRTGICDNSAPWDSSDNICRLGAPNCPAGNTTCDGICPVGQTTDEPGKVLTEGGSEDNVCDYATNTKFTDTAGSFNFSEIGGPGAWNVIWP